MDDTRKQSTTCRWMDDTRKQSTMCRWIDDTRKHAASVTENERMMEVGRGKRRERFLLTSWRLGVLGGGKTRCLITSWRLGSWQRVDTEHASAASHKLPLFPRNCCAVWLRGGVVEARRC
jgi:hypothetical protein